MKPERFVAALPSIVLLLCAFALAYWLNSAKNVELQETRMPIANPTPLIASDTSQADEAGFGQSGSGTDTGTISVGASSMAATSSGIEPAQMPGLWPMFRGSNSDNISKEKVKFDDWSKSTPKVVWSLDAGEGHAGAAVHSGRVYLLDYDRNAQADVLRCLSLADGRQLWSISYPVQIKRNHGISRTIPAVNERYVVTIGPMLHVVCADSKTGQLIWTKNLVSDFGATIPPWYAGQCPLIDGGKLIVAPAGSKTLMAAIELSSGKVLWESPNDKGWTMTHSSIIPATILGRKTYIYCASNGVAGISAADGKSLWKTDQWKVKIANVPSPLPIPGNRVFFTGGYNTGSMMVELEGNPAAPRVKTLYSLQPRVFSSDQQTPIYYNGYVYGVIPGGQLACMSLDGKQIWNSGTDRFGLGPYVAADGKLFALSDNGMLYLVELNSTKYVKLGQAKVLSGHDAWAPIAVAGKRMIMRDLTKIICLEMPTK